MAKKKLSEVTGNTIRRWIERRALELGDEAKEDAKATNDRHMSDYYNAKAEGAWEVVKAIRLGSFIPTAFRKRARK